jgi:hypothetical protein
LLLCDELAYLSDIFIVEQAIWTLSSIVDLVPETIVTNLYSENMMNE